MTPEASEKMRLGRYGSVSGTTGAQPVTSARHWPSCPAVEGSTAERILGSPMVREAIQLHEVLPCLSHRNGLNKCIKSCLLTNQNRLPEPRARADALNPKYKMMKINAMIATTTIGFDESSDP